MRICNSNYGNFNYGDRKVIMRYLTAVFLASALLASLAKGQEKETRHNLLRFQIRPTSAAFHIGENIVLDCKLTNISKKRVLATREARLHDLTYLNVVAQNGIRIPWHGKIKSDVYSSNSFVVLSPGESVEFPIVVSQNGLGYEIDKPGKYKVRAEYSLAPKEYYAPVSKDAALPENPVKSNWIEFEVR